MDDYSDLKVTAGYQEVPALEDYIYVETDGEGNILEPAVTVTERDGVQIVAEGRENRNKSLTFETDSGWYRIEGSFNDGYAAVAELLDWVWKHPIDFARFPIEAGDAYDYVPLADCPDAFSEYLPDFAAFGFTELETHVTLKTVRPLHWKDTIQPKAERKAPNGCTGASLRSRITMTLSALSAHSKR